MLDPKEIAGFDQAIANVAETTPKLIRVIYDGLLRLYELVSCFAVGMTIKQIAEKLDLSSKTVETYREQLKNRFGVESPNELIVCCVYWKLQEQANALVQS